MTTVAWTSGSQDTVSTPNTSTGCCNSSTSGWELNLTEQATSAALSNHDGKIPLTGYPGPIFTVIHVAALISLSLSAVVVTTLLIYLCGFSGSVKHHLSGKTRANGKRAVSKLGDDAVENRAAQRKKTRPSFWKWYTGERLVVYLGLCDLSQAISHSLDHAYILYAEDVPPDRICAAFGFFLHNIIFSQWFVVVATAVSACSLIVFGRKISLGRFDWRLIAFALGIPTIVSVIALSLGLLGASGAWCFIKHGTPSGRLYTQITNTLQIILFGLVGVAYGSIWIKIQRTTKLMKGSTTERYQSSAKVMLIFVAVFIFQWWPCTLFSIWNMFADPPAPVIILGVIVCNLGGVYNTIAYTIIRRRLQRQKSQNFAASNDNITNSANSSGATPRTVSAPRAEHAQGGSSVPEVLDDPDVASQVTQAWSAPIVPAVSQIAQMAADEHRQPDSDAGGKHDVGRIQIHIHT